MIHTPESRERIKTALKKHMSGEEVEPCEYSLITKEGVRIEILLTTKLITYEGEIAILGIVTDITERKKVEEALKEQKLALEQKNIALKEVLEQIETEKTKIKEVFGIKLNKSLIELPLFKEEIRGYDKLKELGKYLIDEDY